MMSLSFTSVFFRMIAQEDLSFACFLLPLAHVSNSKYSLSTLILVFLLFFFRLISPEILSLPPYHQTFWQHGQPIPGFLLLLLLQYLVFFIQGDSVARPQTIVYKKLCYWDNDLKTYIRTHTRNDAKQGLLIIDAETGLLSHPSTLECVSPNSGILFPKCRRWRLESLGL